MAAPRVELGGNLPGVNRYSKEAEWGAAGGLASFALKGRIARVSSIMWATYPFGFDGKADFGQVARHVEVAKGCSRLLVLLSPSQFPRENGEWIPKRETWDSALRATKLTIGEYDRQCARAGMAPPVYQLWNEASPGKPGGPKSGPPGAWDPQLHAFMEFLTAGVGLPPERLVGPAVSSLTDSPAERLG